MGKIGVIVSNLGTPQTAEPKDIARYLREFLMDPLVITFCWPLRFLLVNFIIAPFRSKKTAKNYKKIWLKEGSPLREYTKKTSQDLQLKLGENYKVVTAMRYGKPSFEEAKNQLKYCDEIILFQQYPQFAQSTTITGEKHFKKIFKGFKSKIVPSFYDHPLFIESYVDFLRPQLKVLEYDHLLMSFHGLPESHILNADSSGAHCLASEDCCEKSEKVINHCYRTQCFSTAQGLAQGLGLSIEDYSVSFQSRVGREKWIEPYTENMYRELLGRGFKKIAVICPGFPVDGLETLEEIAIGGRESFLHQGGEAFHFLPCLNNDPGWVAACAEIVLET